MDAMSNSILTRRKVSGSLGKDRGRGEEAGVEEGLSGHW